ncbi:lipocalin-like domain-containing protein [Hyphomicrobium sp.]|uniref:lipocalin-like domain-containing protein n=1 Tax=Hyphomicrobium sp. TaxID=82 RepID=UPI0025C5122C|nr:lipocalin-like domain-containing protein [Hyphomicrobium sp.]MCC7252288.1 iron ABC transporter permease [Hyphomicrobium sp.]
MSARTRFSRVVVVFAILVLGVWCGHVAAQGFAGLGEDAAGFAEVVPGKAITFPEDLGAHPDYRIEWWYVTANLKDAAGTPYGVQWTLFRQANTPGPQREGWASQQVWLGHAAVTTAGAHRFAETLARGGIGQAGVTAEPFQAWIDDWSFARIDGAAGLAATTLAAKGKDFSYALQLRSDRALVLHGDRGFSRKSERGQASYYYSQPFFTVAGTLTLDGRTVDVTGQAWMDREWSSQPLASDQKGWDWFSLHLPGGEKLMLFQLRGAAEAPFRSGSWIGADGAVAVLANDDIELTPGETRVMAGRRLPVHWTVEVKSRGLRIETAPLNAESWMDTIFRYWEGPISFRGSHAGVGYLEMTGYE